MVWSRRTLAAFVAVGAFASATSAAGHAVPRQISHRCPRTFSRAMFDRAVGSAYRSTRLPQRGSYGALWRFARCQRPPSSELLARADWQRVFRGWVRRRHPVFVAPQPDALARCVIAHESGGDPHAVSGQYVGGRWTYEGIGQWSAWSWQHFGGLRYASTPLGASYGQQLAVLMSEGDAGMRDQQGQYDGCS